MWTRYACRPLRLRHGNWEISCDFDGGLISEGTDTAIRCGEVEGICDFV